MFVTPTTGSSASAPHFSVASLTWQLWELSPSPSPPLALTSQCPLLSYGGIIGAECQAKQKAWKAIKRILCPEKSRSSGHKESSESSSLKKRLKIPSPLEYTEDVPMEREPSPNYSKWVPSSYFKCMGDWLKRI